MDKNKDAEPCTDPTLPPEMLTEYEELAAHADAPWVRRAVPALAAEIRCGWEAIGIYCALGDQQRARISALETTLAAARAAAVVPPLPDLTGALTEAQILAEAWAICSDTRGRASWLLGTVLPGVVAALGREQAAVATLTAQVDALRLSRDPAAPVFATVQGD